MKKTLLTGLLSALIIGPTFADDLATMSDVDARNKAYEICKKHEDTHVWVENDGVCVPYDVCQKDKYKDRYCELAFLNVSVSERQAEELIKIFADKWNLDCKPEVPLAQATWSLFGTGTGSSHRSRGEDATGFCKGKDYKQFMFRSVADLDSIAAKRGKCYALSAKYVQIKDSFPGCVLISKADCDRLGGAMAPFDYTIADVWVPSDSKKVKINSLPYAKKLQDAKEYCQLPD